MAWGFMESLSDIAVFVKVVDTGSFTRAATELELSKAAVSKYVGRLEQRLGARLLQRTTRRLTLTEAGEALYRRSALALAELQGAEHDVAQLTGAPRGVLRVSAPLYFGTVSLAPRLREFQRRYPEITLHLELDDRRVDLVRERFDVAVRISQHIDPGLVARRLVGCPMVLVGAPSYLDRRGEPAEPASLHQHECLAYSLARMPDEWRFRASNGRWIAVATRARLRSNNAFVLKQATLDGLGLGLFPDFFVEREMADGRLRALLPDYRTPEASVNAVYASRRQVLPKVRAFVDFLVDQFGGGASGSGSGVRTPSPRPLRTPSARRSR